jgi:putative membrane protein (TIGR04086 family)
VVKKLKLGNGMLGAHTRGTLYALVLTLAAVLILAIAVKYAGMGANAIKPVVQIIKALSIFTGVYAVLRHVEKNAWLHGGILGLVYTVLAFFILSIIDKNFSLTGGFFVDALFALVIGVASAFLLRIRRKNI